MLTFKKKYIMKKIFSLILVSVFALALASCNDWLDINTDPDNTTSTNANCSARLPWIQHAYGYAYGNASVELAVADGQQMSRSSYSSYTDYNCYGLSAGPVNPYQMFFCLAGPNFQDLIDKATAEGAYHYIGAAEVVKAMGFVLMVDLYGEMPFTEALGTILTPAYDDGKTIYTACLALVDDALVQFAKTQEPGATALSEGDNWNGGDVDKWIKLCHGLKARWLNNMSKTADYDMDAILAEVAQGPQSEAESTIIMHYDDLADNVGDPFIGDPLKSSFIFNVAAWGSWNRANEWYMNLLRNSYTGGANVIDPRIHALVPYCERWKDTNNDGVNDTKYWDVTEGVDIINSEMRVDDGYAPYGYTINTGYDDDGNATKGPVKITYTIKDATAKANFISGLQGKHVYSVDGDNVTVEYKYRTYYIDADDYRRAGDTAYLQVRSKQAEVVNGYDGVSTYYWTDADGEKTVANSGTFYSRPEAPTDVLTSFEMNFIKAEVLMRKGDKAGALIAYQAAVKGSIDHIQNKLTEYLGTDSDDYQINPHVGPMDEAQIAAFEASAVFTGPITMQKIMLQKFIAMSYTVQNFNDMRRFNYSAGNVGSFGVIYQDFDRPMTYKFTTTAPSCFPGTSKTDSNYWLRRWMQCSMETRYNEAQLRASNTKAFDKDIWSTPIWWDAE